MRKNIVFVSDLIGNTKLVEIINELNSDIHFVTV